MHHGCTNGVLQNIVYNAAQFIFIVPLSDYLVSTQQNGVVVPFLSFISLVSPFVYVLSFIPSIFSLQIKPSIFTACLNAQRPKIMYLPGDACIPVPFQRPAQFLLRSALQLSSAPHRTWKFENRCINKGWCVG